jgi:cobalt-zinc-cadmium efflux system protein
VRAVLLGREVLSVLGQHAPAGIHPPDAEAALAGVPDVVDVHDLHLWTLTSGMHVATAHLVCRDGADPTRVLTDAAAVLRERFAIDHATIQVEPSSARACVETSW